MAITPPTLQQLQRAIKVSEKIEALQAELAAVLGGAIGNGKRKYTKKADAGVAADATEADEAPAKRKYTRKTAVKVKRTMSPEAREKIAAAQRKRWAKHAKDVKKAKAKEDVAEV